MPDDHPTKQTGNLVGLLAASLALAVVDFVFLGLAIVFGPSGFGGDGTMSRSEVLVANLGQAAGLAGCLLGGAALIWAMAVKAGHTRIRGVKWMVGAQLIATGLLVASTL